MMRIPLAVTTAAILLLTQSVAFAQRSSPRPDRRGDYYSHTANWEVKSSSLNCRSSAGTQYPIITSFARGSRFTLHSKFDAPVIQLDAQRKPWLQVKYAGTSKAPCYVRASNQYVVPIVAGCGRWDPIQQGCYCGVNEWDRQRQECVAE